MFIGIGNTSLLQFIAQHTFVIQQYLFHQSNLNGNISYKIILFYEQERKITILLFYLFKEISQTYLQQHYI